MSVVVYFVSGAEKEYPHACSCTNHGQVIAVRRWNKTTRKYESIASFKSNRVKLAEVRDRFGTIEEIIVGGTHA